MSDGGEDQWAEVRRQWQEVGTKFREAFAQASSEATLRRAMPTGQPSNGDRGVAGNQIRRRV